MTPVVSCAIRSTTDAFPRRPGCSRAAKRARVRSVTAPTPTSAGIIKSLSAGRSPDLDACLLRLDARQGESLHEAEIAPPLAARLDSALVPTVAFTA